LLRGRQATLDVFQPANLIHLPDELAGV